jgi:chorismate dehydratase
MLRAGLADVGIIPVAAYVSIPDLVVIPDIAIAARGPVKSILLISKVPIEEIRTVAADTSSRSSVALLQVLCRKFYQVAPEFSPMEPKLKPMLKRCDAALLIGDPALLAKADGHHVYDLAEEWLKYTGKPFVFAFWALKKGAAAAELVSDFQQSRDHGLRPENMAKTAREWAVRLGLGEEAILSYLRKNIHYYLDIECLSGLQLFYALAAECGALERAPEVEFVAT